MKQSQVALQTDVAADCAGIYFSLDAERIKQVLTNAMLNSIRATEYGSITIAVRRENPDAGYGTGSNAACNLIFSVIDTGCGFGNLDPRRLLNPLYLPEDSGTHHPFAAP